MTPFAIAGIQQYVNPLQSNVDGMIHRLDVCLARFRGPRWSCFPSWRRSVR